MIEAIKELIYDKFVYPLIIAGLCILIILFGYQTNAIDGETARISLNGLLALGTFGYVILTSKMARNMERELEHEKQRHRTSDIISVINNAIGPIGRNIQDIREDLSSSHPIGVYDATHSNDRMFIRLPEISTEYEDRWSSTRLLSDFDAPTYRLFDFYHDVDIYEEKHEELHNKMKIALMEDIDNLEITEERIDDYALTALDIDYNRVDRDRWNDNKDDILKHRAKFDAKEQDLISLKKRIKESGSEIQRELLELESELIEEYDIYKAQLMDPDGEIGSLQI